MPRPALSVTIIALDEQENLPRLLRSVSWAEDVLVVDSGSKDSTVAIAKSMGARVLVNAWKGYGAQKNYAQQNAKHSWILNLDADEEVSPELKKEIEALLTEQGDQPRFWAFSVPRRTFYLGRWIKHGGWYPNRVTRLYHKQRAKWTEPEVHETLEFEGRCGELKSDLFHYTFSGISDQVMTNVKYSIQGSKELTKKGQASSLLKLLIKPFGKFIETYFLKLGFLDGTRGFIISINAAHSMFLKYAYLIENDLKYEATDHR